MQRRQPLAKPDVRKENNNKKRLVRALEGRFSFILATRCAKSSAFWPAKDCVFETCPWWVRAPLYHNCCFVAAEIGEHTLEEVGTMMGLTKERIRQIEMRAIGKLRKFHEEALHKQGLAGGRGKNSSKDKKPHRKDQGNIIYGIRFRNVGVPNRGSKKP